MNRQLSVVLAALAMAPSALLPGVACADTRISFASGVDFSSGDYGQAMETEVVSVPVSVRLAAGDWSLRASIPYLSITGPAEVAEIADGDGGGGTGAVVVRSGTESGFGDVTVAATRSFRHLGGSRAYLDLTGRMRLPTADDDAGMGVGATDYAISTELGNSNDTGGAYISGGRRFLGDHDGRVRQDGWQAGVGGWLRAGEKTRIGAFYSWRDESVKGGEEPSEVGAYVSYRMDDNLRVTLNASGGLSEASPAYAAGFRLTWRSEALNR